MRLRFLVSVVLFFLVGSLVLPAHMSATPSQDEVIERLRNNGYPDYVIERMDAGWRRNRHNTNARFVGASQHGDPIENIHTTPVALTLSGQPYYELVFAEEWNSPVDGRRIVEVHYLWEWHHCPFFRLTDYVTISLRTGLARSSKATYQARSGSHLSKQMPLYVETKGLGEGIVVPLRLVRSFTDSSGRYSADSYQGHVSFTYDHEDDVNPWIHLTTRFNHQFFPSLLQPSWSRAGESFKEWWAPSFFRSTDLQFWKLLPGI